jgi:hypothetical protein
MSDASLTVRPGAVPATAAVVDDLGAAHKGEVIAGYLARERAGR